MRHFHLHTIQYNTIQYSTMNFYCTKILRNPSSLARQDNRIRKNLYKNLRRSGDCLWVGRPAGRPVGVGVSVDSVEVCVKSATRCFIYLFWGSVTLST